MDSLYKSLQIVCYEQPWAAKKEVTGAENLKGKQKCDHRGWAAGGIPGTSQCTYLQPLPDSPTALTNQSSVTGGFSPTHHFPNNHSEA